MTEHTKAAEERQPKEREGGHAILLALFPEFYRRGAHRGVELLHDALVFGIALLFARTHFLFGMYPFAIAYLAARRSRVLPAALGAIAGALTGGETGAVFAVAYLFLLLLRLLFSYPAPGRVILPTTKVLFSERGLLRTLAAALTGAALGGYELAVSRADRYALAFAAVAVLAPSILTLLLVGIYDTPLTAADFLGREEGPRGRSYGAVRPAAAELSILTLLLSVAFALRPLSFFGLSPSSLFAAGATLFTARRFGAARAGVLGLFLGLLGEATLAPAFAILGLLGGLLFPFGTVYGCLGGLLGAIAFAGYAEGVSGFLAVTPEGAVAVLFLFPTLRRLETEPDPAAAELSRRTVKEATVRALTPPASTDHLGRLSHAFSELSSLFFRLSDEERRPAAAEYLVECQKVCARYCATCSNRVRCWEQGERIAERAVYGLASTLRERGRIEAADLPADLRSGCRRIEEILDEIRDECAAMALSHHRADHNDLLSHDYAMLAKILSEAARRDREEAGQDSAAERALCEALGKEAAGLSVTVLGTRRRRLSVGSRERERIGRLAPVLRERAEAALGCALSPPREEILDGVATLTLQGVRRFSPKTATCSVPAFGAGSGDRLRFFETEEDVFYAVLSDGMGSGPDAGATAEVSVEFLETLLLAGTSRAISLQMLNNLVRKRHTECSATVDLFVFDLLHGDATFLKSGAAPSYIKRGGEIFRVRSHTMPLGVSRTPDTERINVEVAAGDVLVLLSDGIVPDGEDPAWLLSLLSAESAEELDALATRIVAEAVSRTPEPRDDITVGLIRLDPKKEADDRETA